MSPAGFFDLGLAELRERCRRDPQTPVAAARRCAEQVALWEGRCQAWVRFDPERLHAQAAAAAERLSAGASPRALEAAALGVKDIINTIDFPTEMGSPLWSGFTPGNDARVVHAARQAGCLVPGKTVSAEFAVHTLGKTLNPHDPAATPGTSSSGSAVAVATGMVPAALATQTAGSIVRPASYCGVYGCKPSFGLIPRTGMLKTTDSLDAVGFFTVFGDDLRRVFEALRVRGPDYPLSDGPLHDPARQCRPAGRPWRVALVRTHTWDDAAEYARAALTAWAGRLADAGVEVVEAKLPPGLEESHRVHTMIYDATLAYYFADAAQRPELVSPGMLEIIERGRTVGPARYREALATQERLARLMDGFFGGCDALVSLSTAGDAPPRDAPEPPDPALIWSLAFLPVIAVPAFRSPRGLPFGLQLVARRYNDLLLFHLADHLRSCGLIPPGPHPALAGHP